MKLRHLTHCFVLGLLALTSLSGFAQPVELTIRPTITLDFPTTEDGVFKLESSTNFLDWLTVQSLRGSGQTSSVTVPSGHKEFFRLNVARYPALTGIELVQGSTNLTPAFSPTIYRYYFQQETNESALRFTFGNEVGEARFEGRLITNGVDVAVSNEAGPRLELELTGLNGLRTIYHIERMPFTFPKIAVTNYQPVDPSSVTLLGVKGTAAAKGVGATTFVAAVDPNGVPYWWKDITLGQNLKLHDNGMVGYTRLAGTNTAGERLGEHVVLDDYFNDLFTLRPANELVMDTHDVFMTKRGTFYTLAYARTNRAVTINGAETNIALKDNIIQEINTSTRELLFEWNTWGHFDYANAKYPQKDDYAHLNWVREDRDGNLIVSARAQSQVIKVNRQTGEVIWRLGRNGDMQVINDPLGGVAGQHAAHTLPNGNLLVFDNRNFGTTNVIVSADGPSRAVEYEIDEQSKRATLVWSYSRPGFHSTSAGGVQRLENGNTLISWGFGPPGFATEVDPAGRIVQDIQITDDQNRHLVGYITYRWKLDHFPAFDEEQAGPQ